MHAITYPQCNEPRKVGTQMDTKRTLRHVRPVFLAIFTGKILGNASSVGATSFFSVYRRGVPDYFFLTLPNVTKLFPLVGITLDCTHVPLVQRATTGSEADPVVVVGS